MSSEETLTAKLLELLAGMNFASRYYEYCDRYSNRGPMPSYGRRDLETALATTSLEFQYHSKERFFSHRANDEVVGLNVAFPHSKVELILTLATAAGDIGGTFAELAEQVALEQDPDFEHSPPYPLLPFSNEAELREAVQFGVSLFLDARQAILSYQGWGRPT